jgi:hypothetical protein
MKKWVLIFFLVLPVSALADRFEYIAQVNQEIPDDDSTGVRDTIFIPDHVPIDEINIYVGIAGNGSAEEDLVSIKSPSGHTVWLNNWGGPRISWYNFWYDTDHPVDGPGQLEDYNGSDAYGPWEMFCFDPFPQYSLFWYTWRIEVYGTPLTGVAEKKGLLPTDFEFSSVYPNPFNSEVSLEYGLPKTAVVVFGIYDIEGRLARTLPLGELAAGYHNVIWDGANNDGQRVSSGVYFIRMAAEGRQFTRSAVMLK